MIRHSIIYLVLFVCIVRQVNAQEIQAKVTVNAQRVGSSVDKKVFTTMQNQLTNLLNTRKWTKDTYQPNEKIQCNFLLNIESSPDINEYKATLTVQAGRPVYNATYQSALVNFQDADVSFKYVEYQPVEFNENRVQGTDGLTANLTAVFAYYVYIILGMDYDSFAPKAGDEYYKKAQNIVNNAPEAKDISGWKTFDGVRNRYWLAENFLNTRYNIVHDVIYDYYRNGLDNLYDNEPTGRDNVLDALIKLQAFNQDNANTMVVQFFMQSKYTELAGIFKKAPPDSKSRALDLLSQLDVANASKYKSDLK